MGRGRRRRSGEPAHAAPQQGAGRHDQGTGVRARNRDNRRMRTPATPLLALTMGDVCGIGPEILAKFFRGNAAAGC